MDHLSYSAINLWLTCPENFRRKYVERQPTLSTPALVFGGAFHETMEGYIRAGKAGSLVDLWPEKWQAALKKDRDVDWGADTPEQHYNEGLRILGAQEVQELADSITPLEDADGLFIERRIELSVPGVDVPVIGYIDIMTADGVPGDFKTSSRKWSQDKADDELQTLFYLAGLNQAGVNVPDLKFRHYVITKTKSVSVQVLEHTHTYAQMLWLFDLIAKVWQAIQADVYPPNPNGWLCGPKYCSYWSDCRGKTN